MDKATKILIIINAVLIVALGIIYFVMFSDSKSNGGRRLRSMINAEETTEIPADREEIQEMIESTLGSDAQKFSVYLFRPKLEKQPLIFQSRPMRPASMIKVFILAKVMQDAYDGKLALDELIPITSANVVGGAGSIAGEGVGTLVPIRKAAELMIIESDNTATNILIDRVGMANLNQYLKDNDYKDTVIYHKMMLQNGPTNLSSAADLGLLFTRIYNHECVNDNYDALMVSYLLRQEDKDCFPAALPYWNIAHKTGEVDDLYDDGGIFYGSQGDFILVIMNDKIDSIGETMDKMKKIASNIARDFMRN